MVNLSNKLDVLRHGISFTAHHTSPTCIALQRSSAELAELAEVPIRAMRPCRERGGTCAEIGGELGVDPGNISNWIGRAGSAGADARRGTAQ